KGESAAREIEDHTSTVVSLGGGEPVLRRCGTGLLESPSLVVEIVRVRRAGGGGDRGTGDRRDRRGRRGGGPPGGPVRPGGGAGSGVAGATRRSHPGAVHTAGDEPCAAAGDAAPRWSAAGAAQGS